MEGGRLGDVGRLGVGINEPGGGGWLVKKGRGLK